MSKDEWRITSAAIESEMERIAGLLQKSAQFQAAQFLSRTSTAHSVRERHAVKEIAELTPQR
jgi:hypothetical protein